MRLFIAICFDEAVVDGLGSAVEVLRSHARQGNFTRRENLHLTLAFLGETERRADLVRILEDVRAELFEVTIGNLGRFRRDGGDLYYLEVKGGDPLRTLHSRLSQALSSAGFAVEDRAFRPHLTLGREVILREGTLPGDLTGKVPQIQAQVTAIRLMHSHRVNGSLVYTPLYERTLL